MSLNENICNAFADYLRDLDYDVSEVLSWEEETRYGGYCETCAYEEIVVSIDYKDSESKTKNYTYYGGLGELMREL